jgi:hypothetical protein
MGQNNRNHPGSGSPPPRYPGTFLLAFREAVESLHWSIQRWLGAAVACQDADGHEHIVGLENLYRRARTQDRAGWPQLLADLLRSARLEELREAPADLAEVADRLLVRVSRLTGEQANEMQIWWEPLHGTCLGMNLVVDYPDAMSYVTREMVESSGRAGEVWLQRAVENLQAQTPAECLQVIHHESGLRQCVVGDAYDSSRVLLLDRLLPETREQGYLVGLPGRDELLVLPVTAPALAYVPMLKGLAEHRFRSAPYAISDEVYWIHQGQWYVFPIEVNEERVTAQPPELFLEVVQRLATTDEE